jgi:hypothetical protein
MTALAFDPGLVLEGPAGTSEIRWGYHCAIKVGAWTVQHGVLTARVLEIDPFRVSQGGLVFVVVRPGGAPWRYPVLELAIAGLDLTATLGAKERIH